MMIRAVAVICSVVMLVLAATAQDSSSVWDGVYTAEQAKRGGEEYARECGNCHGSQLEGADMTPGLTGSVFTSNWDGLTLGDLFDRIRVTMPADRPGSMQRAKIADVIAYVLLMNKFPAGKTELPPDLNELKQIRFTAEKPAERTRN